MHLFICFSSPDSAKHINFEAGRRRRSTKWRVWRLSGDRTELHVSCPGPFFDLLENRGEERDAAVCVCACVCVIESRWFLFLPVCGFSPGKLARAIKSQWGEREEQGSWGAKDMGWQISWGSFHSCSCLFSVSLTFLKDLFFFIHNIILQQHQTLPNVPVTLDDDPATLPMNYTTY